MRLVFVALAVCACHRAPGPATTAPANKAPEADYRSAAADELAFLPIDADFVIGLDFATLRNSRMWATFKPQIDELARRVPELGGACGADMMSSIERISMALKMLPQDKVSGIVVMRGGDMNRAVDCNVKEVRDKGGTVTVDRGTTITTNPTLPGMLGASTVIGGSTMVMQIDQHASHDTLASALASGAPLRQSQAFMKMFNRRERGAALWGMANGNSPAFDAFGGSMRPRGIDGTIVVTDRMAIKLRLTMRDPNEAAQLQAEVDKLKGPASAYVERFEAQVQGEVVVIDVVVTDAQLRALWKMVGGAMGP
jgi:hypothetical protein